MYSVHIDDICCYIKLCTFQLTLLLLVLKLEQKNKTNATVVLCVPDEIQAVVGSVSLRPEIKKQNYKLQNTL